MTDSKERLALIRDQIKIIVNKQVNNKTDKLNKLALWEMKVLSQLEKEVFYDAG